MRSLADNHESLARAILTRSRLKYREVLSAVRREELELYLMEQGFAHQDELTSADWQIINKATDKVEVE
jgi:hypothetical protein